MCAGCVQRRCPAVHVPLPHVQEAEPTRERGLWSLRGARSFFFSFIIWSPHCSLLDSLMPVFLLFPAGRGQGPPNQSWLSAGPHRAGQHLHSISPVVLALSVREIRLYPAAKSQGPGTRRALCLFSGAGPQTLTEGKSLIFCSFKSC